MEVSIQLIAPASGAWSGEYYQTDNPIIVSIQLIAPASGAAKTKLGYLICLRGFHSTDCPSEWGLRKNDGREIIAQGFQSTDCPS